MTTEHVARDVYEALCNANSQGLLDYASIELKDVDVVTPQWDDLATQRKQVQIVLIDSDEEIYSFVVGEG